MGRIDTRQSDQGIDQAGDILGLLKSPYGQKCEPRRNKSEDLFCRKSFCKLHRLAAIHQNFPLGISKTLVHQTDQVLSSRQLQAHGCPLTRVPSIHEYLCPRGRRADPNPSGRRGCCGCCFLILRILGVVDDPDSVGDCPQMAEEIAVLRNTQRTGKRESGWRGLNLNFVGEGLPRQFLA